MSEEYARAIGRVAVAQLAEADGFESVQESALEILSELLLRYLSELSTGAHSFAEHATRSQINVPDVLMAIEDMGTSVNDLLMYMETPFMKNGDCMFAHTLPSFPVKQRARTIPTFEEKGEQPPSHIPAFLPAFPDVHTYENTPTFTGHEKDPEKQTQAIKLQRKAAEKALIQLHKRTKAEVGGQDAQLSHAADGQPAGMSSERMNPFLGDPDREYTQLIQDRVTADRVPATSPGTAPDVGTNTLAARTTYGSSGSGSGGIVAVPGALLMDSCPHHIVFDTHLVLRKLGPAVRREMPWVELGRTLLTEAFQVLHPEGVVLTTLDGSIDQARVQEEFCRNPFRTFSLQTLPRSVDGNNTSQNGGGLLELEGHILPTRLHVPRNVERSDQDAQAGAAPGAGAGEEGGSVEDVFLMLSLPSSSSAEELKEKDIAAEKQMEAAKLNARSVNVVASAESAFQALLTVDGTEQDVLWKYTGHFEDSGGALKPGFEAGFSQDWATATRRAALAVASRHPTQDAVLM